MTLLLGLCFVLVAAAVFAAGSVYTRLQTEPSGTAEEPDGPGSLESLLVAAGSLLQRPGTKSDDVRRMLFRAGHRSPSGLAAFHGVQVFGALGFALILCGLLTITEASDSFALMALSGAGFGFLLPPRVLAWQVSARAARIREAIPPALDLMVLALEAGQTIDQSMHDTAVSLRDAYPDLSSELLFCNLEMRAGTARTDALRRLAERCGEDEVKKLAAVLIDGERFGTGLGPALRTHTRFLRTRMRQRAQESARKLSVKMVLPVFFLIFPSVMLVTLGPAYIQLKQFLGEFLKQ